MLLKVGHSWSRKGNIACSHVHKVLLIFSSCITNLRGRLGADHILPLVLGDQWEYSENLNVSFLSRTMF